MKLVEKWIRLPDVLVAKLKTLPETLQLMSDFEAVVQSAVTRYKCREWSLCMELSLNSEDVGRMHLHAFLERHCRSDSAWAKWSSVLRWLKIREVPVSHSNPCGEKNRGRNRGRALTEGHYYCQARKIGHVMHKTTVPVFDKLFPDSRMVTTLWRTRKMTTVIAKEDVLATRDRAPAVISLLDATMALEYGATLEKEAQQSDLMWRRNPFKPASDAELEWVRQYALLAMKPHMSFTRAAEYCRAEDVELSESLRRCKFLVYDGPSRMGKTELSMAWFGSDRTLVVNAQEQISPNLRPMQTGRYDCILFDEGSWQLAASNKALFQGSSRPVELSQSQCNDRCYRVLLFRVPMIICSNDFWGGCKDSSIRDWIEKNSCYVSIQTPVFEIIQSGQVQHVLSSEF